MKLKGLIVREEPMAQILKGVKTWELRSRRTHIRGKIALITSGSGTVVGTAEVVECIGPLTVEQWNSSLRKMGLSKEDRIKSKREIGDVYAWVIKSAKKLKTPKSGLSCLIGPLGALEVLHQQAICDCVFLRANSRGVKFPIELCGRHSLYSILHFSTSCFACLRF